MEIDRKKCLEIVFWLLLLCGLFLLLYPTGSNLWNERHQSHALANYQTGVENLKKEEYETLLSQAHQYNASLLEQADRYHMGEEEEKMYENIFCVEENGIMGAVEIPKIDILLPIYHGTKESVLQMGVGHLPGSSLPVGGENAHCVLVGHRGLPSAKLFTDLDKLVEGDLFFLRILNETYTYQVDQILVVEPDQMDALKISEGKDECTLVTCTPYGINSHRLLVRGQRTQTPQKTTEKKKSNLWKKQVFFLIMAVVLSLALIAKKTVSVCAQEKETGSISIKMQWDGIGISGGNLTLYRLKEKSEAEEIKKKKGKGIKKEINQDGTVTFFNLKPGYYYLVQEEAAEGFERILPFLVELPMQEKNQLIYHVQAEPKMEKKTMGWKEKIDSILPQTGQRNWPVPVLAVSGLLLFLIGKKMRKND
jgi:sortase A